MLALEAKKHFSKLYFSPATRNEAKGAAAELGGPVGTGWVLAMELVSVWRSMSQLP